MSHGAQRNEVYACPAAYEPAESMAAPELVRLAEQ